MEKQIARLIAAMVRYDKGDARRIQHFMKVHDFAATIGTAEGLDAATQFVLEAAAVLHDIGIHVCEQKYEGQCNGKLQEKEGPAEAEKLLLQQGGYTRPQIDRICWLIAHHHTYTNVQGMDYQILLEADFLVNIYEDELSPEAVETARTTVFRTVSGRQLLDDMFSLS